MVETKLRKVGKLILVLLGGVIGFALGYISLITVQVEPVEAALVTVVTLAGLIIFKKVGDNILSPYNVVEVGVEGPILRKGFPFSSSSSDDVVDLIENAQDADALLIRINSPGGNIVPSDDIRKEIEEFDGPTIAYVTDICASGGYWIASACDSIVVRETSLVGSIGVIGSRINAKELADKIGLSYQRLAAGKYKDAGTPLKDMSDEEKNYLQGIIDDFYNIFIDKVAESRNLDKQDVKDTEAKVYLGEEAMEIGLVDDIGTREKAKEKIEEEIGKEAIVKELKPKGLKKKVKSGVNGIAYSFGAGFAEKVSWKDFEFKI